MSIKHLAFAVIAITATGITANAAEPPRKSSGDNSAISDMTTGYATVNGLRMYYEVHGAGEPLLVLHGAFGWANVPPTLAKNRKVIAVELQGHGHTADIDRQLSFEQMADDTAALLKELKLDQVDVFGYSMGGNVGLALAIRHPKLVRRLAINGSHFGKLAEAFDTASFEQFQKLPADFAPPVLKDTYDKVAPDPKNWPKLVAKVKKMELEFPGFARDDLKSVQASVLVTLGDRDGIRVEHAVELYRLIPKAELAVFPGADHLLLWQDPEKMLPTIAAFLNSPTNKP